MVDQTSIALGLSSVERLFKRIEHEIGTHRTDHPPADDPAGKHVDDEGDMDKSLPSGHIREIGHPQLIGPIGLELPIHPILRTRRRRIGEGGAHHLAAPDPLQAQAVHQPFDGTADHLVAFAL